MSKSGEQMAVNNKNLAQGTDGSDHTFRMLIENRYKNLVILRKYNRILLILHVILIIISSIWNAIPLIFGLQYPLVPGVMLVAEILALIFYILSKIGTSKESILFLKLYGTVIPLLAAEHALARYIYHVRTPKDFLFPKVLSDYLAMTTMRNTEFLLKALRFFEAAMDSSLLIVLIFASLTCYSYFNEKRVMMREGDIGKNKKTQ